MSNFSIISEAASESNFSISNANRTVSSSVANINAVGSIAVNTGKWYWEVTVNSFTSAHVGIMQADGPLSGVNVHLDSSSWWISLSDGNRVHTSSSAYDVAFVPTDIVMIAVDMDAGEWWVGKNGVWLQSGDPENGLNPTHSSITGAIVPAFNNAAGAAASVTFNFGDQEFTYAPPEDFLEVNTNNLPDPSITDPRNHFNSLAYTGTGVIRPIREVGFAPDLVWIKNRTSGTEHHHLEDRVRGAGIKLTPSLTDAESTNADTILSFDNDGFTVGADATTLEVNNSGDDYISWNWKESLTSGLQITAYTGNGSGTRNITHSLGEEPKFVMLKARSAGSSRWRIYHDSVGGTQTLYLDGNDAFSADTDRISATSSTNFTVVSSGAVGTNQLGTTYIAYAWKEVSGFSKFGSYTGNGSTDGPFVWCGFRPAYLLIKRTDSTGSWYIFDTTRSSFNTIDDVLTAETNDAESTSINNNIHFFSNGFGLKNTTTELNASGGNFIFAAFGEAPIKTAKAFGPSKERINQIVVPEKAIIGWEGTVASIPTGWFLCDGTNGTPDLTDRMIVGADGGTFVKDTTGGSDTTAITGTTSTDGAHTGAADTVGNAGAGSGDYTATAGGHSHTVTGTMSAIPPSYKLAYIMAGTPAATLPEQGIVWFNDLVVNAPLTFEEKVQLNDKMIYGVDDDTRADVGSLTESVNLTTTTDGAHNHLSVSSNISNTNPSAINAPETMAGAHDHSGLNSVTKTMPPYYALTPLRVDETDAPVPKMILAYSGSLANLPSGWVQCDGLNGTPNLLGKFPVGTGSFSIGDTGGSTTPQASGSFPNKNVNHTHIGGGPTRAGTGFHAAFSWIHNHTWSTTVDLDLPSWHALYFIMLIE